VGQAGVVQGAPIPGYIDHVTASHHLAWQNRPVLQGTLLDFLRSPIVLAFVCAYTYYVLGAYEEQQGGSHHGVLWAALSLGVSFVVACLFKGGWGVLLIVQVALFFGIAVFRAMRQS
jgi:hypothetical protein